jgi:hypothetical protein
MKQGSAFPYISYAVTRRARIGFSLMTHCLCHERGTRFSAVPGSTTNTHGLDGYYLGPALDHYRCYQVHITKNKRDSDC